jgi:ABC-type lipoprotein export system ATPase subunit
MSEGSGSGPGAILRAVALRKVFRSGHEDLVVFDGVSLEVRQGSTVVITGESGSGKTTLLNLLGTLDSPTSGRIYFRGEELSGKGEPQLMRFRNEALGFIFQFHYLLKDLSALENVLLPSLIGGAGRGASRRRAEMLLERVGLAPRRGHYPVELSGGERQRVAVARALMNDPELILADEPTGNLDERNSAQVQELLFGLVQEYGKTMILVTHATELARTSDARYLLEHRSLRRL